RTATTVRRLRERAGRRRMSSETSIERAVGRPGFAGHRRDGEIASQATLPPGRRSCRDGLGQPEPDRDRGGLDPTRHAELGEDVADVDTDRLLADEQSLADLAIRAALRDQGEDLALPWRQAERVLLGDGHL